MPVSLGGGVLGAGHDVEAAVLGHHAVLLGLRVHHARQPGLLAERVPAASRCCLGSRVVIDISRMCSQYSKEVPSMAIFL